MDLLTFHGGTRSTVLCSIFYHRSLQRLIPHSNIPCPPRPQAKIEKTLELIERGRKAQRRDSLAAETPSLLASAPQLQPNAKVDF